MATTSSSWTTSSDPDTMKHSRSRLSPWWKTMSPGAQWMRLKCTAKARRQPLLARRNAGFSVNTVLLRWMHRSALMSFGQLLITWHHTTKKTKVVFYVTPYRCGYKLGNKFPKLHENIFNFNYLSKNIAKGFRRLLIWRTLYTASIDIGRTIATFDVSMPLVAAQFEMT